ncbi:hypothetical protein MHYP_G00173690 [Metynnis hypsauchen]
MLDSANWRLSEWVMDVALGSQPNNSPVVTCFSHHNPARVALSAKIFPEGSIRRTDAVVMVVVLLACLLHMCRLLALCSSLFKPGRVQTLYRVPLSPTAHSV